MISRIALTLALASSVAITAAQEKTEKCPLGQNTKVVAGLAAVGGLAAVAYGSYSLQNQATVAGIGVLTGLGCAALEQYTQYYLANNKLMPFVVASSWVAERNMRGQTIFDMGVYTTDNSRLSRQVSWASYLVYLAARYTDGDFGN